MGKGHYGDIAIDSINITNKDCLNGIKEVSFRTWQDKQARNFTLDMFILYLQMIEKEYPEHTPREIAHKLRIVAGYNSTFWRQMLFGFEFSDADVIAPFKHKTNFDKNIFTQLNLMMQHSSTSGVVKNHDEIIAIGHVLTGITAGYDRKILKQYIIITIDNLFATTISGDLGQSALQNYKDSGSPIIGPKGSWLNGKYSLGNGKVGEATHAEIIGDIDGFNLGHLVTENTSKPLSEHLKEYYCEKSTNRFDLFKGKTTYETLRKEVQTFIYGYAVKVLNVPKLKVIPLYNNLGKTAVNAFCEEFQQLEDWCKKGWFWG
ncbi:uncharacterized protein LOC128241910 [Mya arenaria]|nr:uncharacterized protein LOC128241910 [Mya arenaria]